MDVVTEKPTTKTVPEGFKRTEVGVLPEDWQILKLDDYTTKIGSGITPRGGRKVYTAEGRPFIRSQNVDWGYLNLDDLAFIDEKTHKSFDATELLEDDVLLNITGASIGRSTMVTDKIVGGNVNQHVCIIRTLKEYIEPTYLNFVLISNIGQDQVASHQAGGNREGLNFGQIGKFKIPTPPTLEEQQAIAHTLSDVDALIAELDTLIKKKQQVKKGAMQQLLTGKKRLPGFEGEWEEYSLIDLADNNTKWSFTGGPFGSDLKTEHYTEKGIRVIQLQNIGDGKFINENEVYTTEEKANELISNNIYPGEIILSKMGDPVARACIVPDIRDRYLMCSDGIRLKVDNEKFDTKFVHAYLNFKDFRERAESASSGSTRKRIGLQNLKKLNVRTPSLKEQKAIAQILSDMEAEIQALQSKQSKYEKIKHGMMQELLTGKTRLV